MKNIKNYKIFESEFVNQQDINDLLDKISEYGIESITDIDKNRVNLFSEGDKEIIETIEKMGDITAQFKQLNNEIRRLQDSGESDGFHLMKDWTKLNSKMVPLEQSFRKWGIELGDPRLSKMMNKIRPDVYGTNIYNENYLLKESIGEEIVFTNKRNRNIKITISKSPDGRIKSIENETGIRFPFSIGQIMSRNIETWACNNNFLMSGNDTCPEKKIFGVKVSDVPKGHEWRHIYPNKFR